MLSDCHHLETFHAVVPTSDANSARVGHSSMIERNDTSVMDKSLGGFILNGKGNYSPACEEPQGHNGPMAKNPGKSAFRAIFIERVRWARINRPYTQEVLADLLGIPQDTYKTYETNTYMPPDLIPRFCAACGIDENWLYTERGKAPVGARPDERQPRKTKARSKTKAA